MSKPNYKFRFIIIFLEYLKNWLLFLLSWKAMQIQNRSQNFKPNKIEFRESSLSR